MNIHGYKKKKQSINRLLQREHNKSKEDRCDEKIKRLEDAKRNCIKTIQNLKYSKKRKIKKKKN